MSSARKNVGTSGRSAAFTSGRHFHAPSPVSIIARTAAPYGRQTVRSRTSLRNRHRSVRSAAIARSGDGMLRRRQDLLSLPEIWIGEDRWTCSSFAIILPANVDGYFGALDLRGLDLANARGTPVGDPVGVGSTRGARTTRHVSRSRRGVCRPACATRGREPVPPGPPEQQRT